MANLTGVLDVVRSSLKCEGGVVSFRSRTGRGSGKAFEIPTEQFEEFVQLLTEVRKQTDVVADQTTDSEV